VRSTLVKLEGLDALMDGRVDGAVVLGGDLILPEDREQLTSSSLPVVFLSNNFELAGCFQILSGAQERTRDAANHLFSLGHRRVGISGYYQDAHYMRASVKGLQDAYTARGFEFDPRFIATPNGEKFFDAEDLKERLKKLREAGVTALISTEVVEALMAVQLLKEAGLSTPRDMSILSFGPMWKGVFMDRPVLTTFDADLTTCGHKCFEMFKQARDGGVPRTEVMKWELAPGGETVGPPTS